MRVFAITLGLVLMAHASPSTALAVGAQPLVSDGALEAPLGLTFPVPQHISSDGAFLYATGLDKVGVYAWDPVTPNLSAIQVLRDDTGGIDGLESSSSFAVSPGEEHVYVASWTDGAIALFSRDAGTGLLTFVEATYASLSRGPLRMSADGKHLYAGFSGSPEELGVFSRDLVTGSLTFAESEPYPLISNPFEFVVTPDGGHIYAASWSRNLVHIFERDPGSGELTYVSDVSTTNPSGLTVSPDSLHVYVTRTQTAEHYARDPVTGALTLVGPMTGIYGNHRMLITPDGLRALSENNGWVETYTRDLVSGALTLVSGQWLSFGLVLSSDEEWLFQSRDGLHVQAVAPALTISHVGRHQVPGGNQPTRAGAVSPDGEHMYVVGEAMLIVYDRDPATGHATVEEVHTPGLAGVDGIENATDVVVSPDGAYVFVVGTEPTKVAVFSRDGATGHLTFVEAESVGEQNFGDPPQLVVSSDVDHVYAINYELDSLSRFDFDDVTGDLTYVENVATFNEEPAWLLISSDGASVYVAGDRSGTAFKDLVTTVSVYARDAGTGALTLASTLDAPNRSTGADISSDDAHVYIASELPDSGNLKAQHELGSYVRDAGTGALTKIDAEISAKHGVFVDEPQAVAVSADDSHVYVVLEGNWPDTGPGLASFVRDPFTGHLSFVEVLDEFRVPLLVGLTDEHIYVLPEEETYPDTLARFSRGFQCSDTPAAGCRTPVKATLQMIDDAVKDKSDRINFTWRGDTPTTHAELDPVGKNYAVCVYDQSGAPDRLLVGALVPADQVCGNAGKPCWTDKIKKIKYKDSNKTPEGASLLILQPHDTKPQVKAKLQSVDLGWRVASALPPSLPILVQVQGETGPCFEASFFAAIKNDGRQFKSVAIP